MFNAECKFVRHECSIPKDMIIQSLKSWDMNVQCMFWIHGTWIFKAVDIMINAEYEFVEHECSMQDLNSWDREVLLILKSWWSACVGHECKMNDLNLWDMNIQCRIWMFNAEDLKSWDINVLWFCRSWILNAGFYIVEHVFLILDLKS